MGCIYAILNLINNKKYIGSTKNLEKRKSKHLSLLRNQKHHSLSLQSAFNKYGEDNFVFVSLKEITDNTELRKVEQEFLDKFKTYNKKYGYNMSNDSGFPSTSRRRVLQYTKGGVLVNIYTDCVKASEAVQCNSSGISKCCREGYRFYKGFLWFYQDEFSEEKLKQKVILANSPIKRSEKTKELQSKIKLGKKLTEAHKLACSIAHRGKTPSNLRLLQQANKKPVLVYFKSGEFIKEFNSVAECQAEYPGCQSQLTGLTKNPRKYIFKYKLNQ